jgi:tRNA G10  N-methylase Trm11
MRHFFILGSNKSLSLSELIAYFSPLPAGNGFSLSEDGSAAFLDTFDTIDADAAIRKLGGTIKIGLIEKTSAKEDFSHNVLFDILKRKTDITEGGKFPFGISAYGRVGHDIKKTGMSLKTRLKESGINPRWVDSRERQLSSVVVETNKLASRGVELVLISCKNDIASGRTIAVQPFRELSFRDYGRPARDDRSGMLPPKLAQVMLNLSGAAPDSAVLDPFCGSGTILTEAMLRGFKNLSGADISSKAVTDTKANSLWIKEKFHLANNLPNLRVADACSLSKIYNSRSFDAIITEPFLGPQRGHRDFQTIADELSALYSMAIKEFSKILKQDGRAVMIWPVLGKQLRLNPGLSGFRIKPLLPPELVTSQTPLTDRGTIIYGRANQQVWREIVVLEKI